MSQSGAPNAQAGATYRSRVRVFLYLLQRIVLINDFFTGDEESDQTEGERSGGLSI